MNKINTSGLNLGVCNGGNIEEFGQTIYQAVLNRTQERFYYMEIGVAEARTMQFVRDFLHKNFADLSFTLIGVDIPGGWSLEQSSVERNLSPEFEGFFDKTYEVEKYQAAYVILSPSQTVLAESTLVLDCLFIDGCHGKPCVVADFELAQPHLHKGSFVIFHDTDERCQGESMQPHCQTGIDARQAIKELGLFDESRKDFKLVYDTNPSKPSNGIVVVEKID